MSIVDFSNVRYALFQGFGLGFSLIVAIGVQNAFVLKQGLARNHVFLICTICMLSDAALIALGCAGVGAAIASNDWLLLGARWGGAAFLVWMGINSLRAMLRDAALLPTEGGAGALSVRAAVSTTLALTFLNPHVYLDTVLLLGGIAGQFPAAQRLWFGVGAALASFTWFYALGYGAGWLAPLFRRPFTWRVLDGLIAAIMFGTAATLALS